MISDKNKPHTWRAYKPSLCETCFATCCTMPLEVRYDDLITMGLIPADDAGEEVTKKKIQQIVKRLQKLGVVKSYRSGTGLFLMNSKPNGDCQFLNEKRRCSIYKNRPEVCRKFPETIGLRWGFCPYQKK